MKPKYDATVAALDHYDRVDAPALEALCSKSGAPTDLARYVDARRIAADRVRAAFCSDIKGLDTPENVELLSVDIIRRTIKGTFLGNLLASLP